ncbi:MAG: phosphate signaling complex protein PhoU [Brachymonas sp.]|uniref:phosphate signaling complex protein PhoU n=1 Tax=unclassified Brachymonas TaxID=2621329 RepID=UPI0035B0EF06
MPEKHLSSQFDAELNHVSSMVMEMGGLVEQQMRQAVEAMIDYDADVAQSVLKNEPQVNAMEMEIDHEMTSIIGRRQPTARDLRLLIAISRTTANLERAGDEAAKIARTVQGVIQSGFARSLPSSELRVGASLASDLLRKSLDAFARLDVRIALDILREDNMIDAEYDGFMRKLVTYMMEDPRTITASLDLMFLAKSIERIGDHAKNIAESVIYIVNGLDVRHTPLQTIESQLN